LQLGVVEELVGQGHGVAGAAEYQYLHGAEYK
jgi:hypothetical protein